MLLRVSFIYFSTTYFISPAIIIFKKLQVNLQVLLQYFNFSILILQIFFNILHFEKQFI